MNKIFEFSFHGVKVMLCTDQPKYLEPATRIFSRYVAEVAPDADLRVNIIHADSFWGTDGHPKSREALETRMEKIGRRVFVYDRTVFVNRFVGYPGLAAYYQEEGTAVSFDLIYDETFAQSGIDLYQSCHQLFGIWPVATYLAKHRNMFFLHGGAVSFEGRNIAFCGLQGVGKSTLLLRMLRDPEAQFLSDNIYFHDAEKVYACPETLRLDDQSLAFIDPPAGLLQDTGFNSDLGRKMYLVDNERTAETMTPDVFLVPRFHPEKSGIIRAQEDMSNVFMAFCELAMELNAFNQWAAPFLLSDGAFLTKRIAALRTLLETKPVYHLHIRKGDDPDAILKLIRSV